MFESLSAVPRLLIEVDLVPVQGERFQPTGFADIGHARYDLPDGTRMLLVETAQSMANRLEATCIGADGDLIPSLQGLPYVRVLLTGGTAASTTSLVEAHRLNSPFIMAKKTGFADRFAQESGYSKGAFLDFRKVGRALLRFDVNALLHGAFLSNFEDGRVRVPRILTAFIEARDVREAVSGGVKNSPLDPTGKLRAVADKGEKTKDVYSNVPYHRIEYTAGRIVAFFNLDLSLLRGYGLPAEAQDMMIALALYKVRKLLDGGLRLRTACDLESSSDLVVKRPEAFSIPGLDALERLLGTRIRECAAAGLFADPPVTQLACETKWEKASDKNAAQVDEEESQD
jgi:CRISPR-associated protein Csb1